MGGLWKKLDHEKSLRRDRAKKESYEEGFVEPAVQAPEQKRPFGLRVTKGGLVVQKSKSFSGSILRERALKDFRRKMSGPFVVNGHRFSYAWTVEEFAEANSIDLKKAKGLQDGLRETIKQKRKFAEQRIIRAQNEDGYATDEATGLSQRVCQLSYQLEDLFGFLD